MATVSFEMAGMHFEYDDKKNKANIKKHGIDFRSAARVFFDYDRVEYADEDHSEDEDRYDTIGDTSVANIVSDMTVIGTPLTEDEPDDVLFVVYTDRIKISQDGKEIDVTRLISARLATDFERGMYMVNTNLYTEAQLRELAFTKEEREQLAKARKMPITFDEECPPTTPEKALKFRRVNPPRRTHCCVNGDG